MGDPVDLVRRHLAGNIADLLADVVSPGPGREPIQLRPDIDGRLAAEPGTAGFGFDVAAARAAGRDVAHRQGVDSLKQ